MTRVKKRRLLVSSAVYSDPLSSRPQFSTTQTPRRTISKTLPTVATAAAAATKMPIARFVGTTEACTNLLKRLGGGTLGLSLGLLSDAADGVPPPSPPRAQDPSLTTSDLVADKLGGRCFQGTGGGADGSQLGRYFQGTGGGADSSNLGGRCLQGTGGGAGASKLGDLRFPRTAGGAAGRKIGSPLWRVRVASGGPCLPPTGAHVLSSHGTGVLLGSTSSFHPSQGYSSSNLDPDRRLWRIEKKLRICHETLEETQRIHKQNHETIARIVRMMQVVQQQRLHIQDAIIK